MDKSNVTEFYTNNADGIESTTHENSPGAMTDLQQKYCNTITHDMLFDEFGQIDNASDIIAMLIGYKTAEDEGDRARYVTRVGQALIDGLSDSLFVWADEKIDGGE